MSSNYTIGCFLLGPLSGSSTRNAGWAGASRAGSARQQTSINNAPGEAGRTKCLFYGGIVFILLQASGIFSFY